MRLALHVAAVLVVLGIAVVGGQPQPGRIAAETAPIFLRPDASRTPLTTVRRGTMVTILSAEGDWLRVQFRDHFGERTGYVEARHVQQPVSAMTPAAVQAPAAATPPTPSPAPAAVAVSATPAAAPMPAPEPAAATPVAPAAPSVLGLPESVITEAIAVGSRGRGREHGLRLLDSGQQFAAALTANSFSQGSEGFSLRAYTPIAWLRQLAGDAAKEYRTLSIAELTPENTEPVLRVFVNPDTPNTVSARGMAGTSSVRHVVLRDEQRRIVIQPLSKEPFAVEAANAMGGRANFEGVVAKFAMDALREVRGSDGEFFITVIGSTGEEKNFKVKKKHFERLP